MALEVTLAKQKTRANLDEQAANAEKAGPDHVVYNREEIAKAEIESAIELFYRDRAVVASHVLACAAGEILRGLLSKAEQRSIRDRFEGDLKESFGEDQIAEIKQYLDLPFNFFKHSSSDRTVELPVRPEFVEAAVFHACHDFRTTFGYLTPLMSLAAGFYICRNPQFFPEEAGKVRAAMGVPIAIKLSVPEIMTLGEEHVRKLSSSQPASAGRLKPL